MANYSCSDEDLKLCLSSLSCNLLANSPLMIQQVDDTLRLVTRPEYGPILTSLIPPIRRKLSQAALETLAIIAYEQPIEKQEIDRIRGADCEAVLETLKNSGLIKTRADKNNLRNPLLYFTTKYFLFQFGLHDLSDLPPKTTLRSIE